jgi:hypothetical protein
MDQPLDLACRVPRLDRVDARLFFRHGGQEHFTPVIMERRGGEYHGRIPSHGVIGKALQYYIEARDEGGRLVGSSGGALDPHTVLIVCPCVPPP